MGKFPVKPEISLKIKEKVKKENLFVLSKKKIVPSSCSCIRLQARVEIITLIFFCLNISNMKLRKIYIGNSKTK